MTGSCGSRFAATVLTMASSACVLTAHTNPNIPGSAAGVVADAASGSGSGATVSGPASGPASGSSGGTSVSVTINPQNAFATTGAVKNFSCAVSGTTNTACAWFVTESSGGSITTDGAYTAPASVGTFHIVATSAADATVSATATMTVSALVTGCTGPVGQWQNITPPLIKLDQWCSPGDSKTNCGQSGAISLAQVLGGYTGQIPTYGAGSYALDNKSPGTIYLGTQSLGIWKSTDCGADWIQIDTGVNADKMDQGRQNSLIIDPLDSKTMYGGALYGYNNIWRSTDGGVDWEAIMTSPGVLSALVYNGFVSGLSMDPDDHYHLATTPHAACVGMALPGSQLVLASDSQKSTLLTGCSASAAPNGAVTGNCPVTPNADYSGWSCMLDGHYVSGNWSWQIVANGVPWGGDGGGVYIVSGNRWLYGGGQDSVFLTTNGGGQVNDGNPPWQVLFGDKGISTFYRASNHMLFTANGLTSKYSADNGSTWHDTHVAGSLRSFADDGETMFIAGGFFGGDTYLTSPVATLFGPSAMVSPMDSPVQNTNGGDLLYDPNFKILYSGNGTGGMWRRVVK